MIVGTCKFSLYIKSSFSLKDKRKVIKSITDRIKSRYNVSISEIDANDNHKNAVIGIAMISREKKIIESTFSKIKDFIYNNYDILIIDSEVEFW